ncbi:MAG: hypothetical protein IJ462_03110 [Clostridia bacterium]|nr:hypothetical protein [Clostridia bacterium]
MKLAGFFEDMTVFRDKTAGARSLFTPYSSFASALDGKESDRRIELNGKWRFGYYTSVLRVPEAALRPDTDLSRLPEIELPCNLNSNDIIPAGQNISDIPFDPPYIPPDTPAAVFVKDIEVNENTDLFRKYMVFEGVSSCVYLYVNGEYAGFAEVTSALQEFDITDLLHHGSNRIAAVVMKFCDGSYLEKRMGELFGIYADSYILLRPKGHIRDFIVSTKLSNDCTKGYINVTVDAVVYSGMTALLYSPQNEFLLQTEACDDGHITFEVDSPAFYSAENPELYTVILSFGGEYIPVKTGIRETVFDQNGLLYNKKRITLKPVLYGKRVKPNGQVMTKNDYINELSVLKQHSVNTIVTDAAPLLPVFYELCDRYGFYIINTAELYAEKFEQYLPDTISSSNEWEGAVYNRLNLLTARDKNHSSVLAWNIDGSVKEGKNIFFTAERVNRLDKMRCVHYGSQGRGGFSADLLDFDSLVYFDGRFKSKELSQKIKRLYKPITVTPLDLEGGRFEIQNELDFSYISNYEIFYEISEFGRVTDAASLGIMTLASKKSAEFCLQLKLPQNADSAIRFYYKNIYGNLLTEGHTMGFDCFEIKRPYRRTEKLLPDKKLTLNTTDAEFSVQGKDFSLVFDRAKGYITRVMKGGTEVVSKVVPSVFLKEDSTGFANEIISVRDSDAVYDELTGQIYITCLTVIAERGKPHHIQAKFYYTVNKAGEVTVKYTFIRDNEIAGISRVGFDMYMPQGSNTAEYYCLGPVSFKGDTDDGYLGRFKHTVRAEKDTHHHSRARFVAVYDSARCGVIAYKKQDEFSFFVNTRSQHQLWSDAPETNTVVSVNAEIGRGILTDMHISGEISFRPINTDDGSLWGNATAVYKN